jgi:hypothetical protein
MLKAEREERTRRRAADSLDVCEGNATRIFEVSLATVNQTLDHLAPELRTMRDGWVRPSSGLNEAAHAALKSRCCALVRKPYRATCVGGRTKRTVEGSKSGSAPVPDGGRRGEAPDTQNALGWREASPRPSMGAGGGRGTKGIVASNRRLTPIE